LLKLRIPLHPISLGSDVRKVITQTWSFAYEQLHASLYTSISVVLGRPLPNKSLSTPNSGHRIFETVSLLYSITAPFFVWVAEQTPRHIRTRPDVTANICPEWF